MNYNVLSYKLEIKTIVSVAVKLTLTVKSYIMSPAVNRLSNLTWEAEFETEWYFVMEQLDRVLLIAHIALVGANCFNLQPSCMARAAMFIKIMFGSRLPSFQ